MSSPLCCTPQNAVRGTCFALATFLSTALIGVVVKWLPADTPSTTIGFFQFFVGATDLSLGLQTGASVSTTRWPPEPQNPTPGVHLLRSISGLFAHLFFYVAIVYVPLVDANLLLSAAPLWVPLLLLVFLRRTVARALSG